jgi:hypothetical protein
MTGTYRRPRPGCYRRQAGRVATALRADGSGDCCCAACSDPCDPGGWTWFSCAIDDWATFSAALDLSACTALTCDATCLTPPDDCTTPPYPLPFAWNPNESTCGTVYQWDGTFGGEVLTCGIVAIDYVSVPENILAIGNVPVYATLSFDVGVCAWVLTISCGIDGTGGTIWTGQNTGNLADPSGTYSRTGGSSATPASVDMTA